MLRVLGTWPVLAPSLCAQSPRCPVGRAAGVAAHTLRRPRASCLQQPGPHTMCPCVCPIPITASGRFSCGPHRAALGRHPCSQQAERSVWLSALRAPTKSVLIASMSPSIRPTPAHLPIHPIYTNISTPFTLHLQSMQTLPSITSTTTPPHIHPFVPLSHLHQHLRPLTHPHQHLHLSHHPALRPPHVSIQLVVGAGAGAGHALRTEIFAWP